MEPTSAFYLTTQTCHLTVAAWFQPTCQDTGAGDQSSSCEELLADPGVVEVSPHWLDRWFHLSRFFVPVKRCRVRLIQLSLKAYVKPRPRNSVTIVLVWEE